jgi:hypothetical protein
MRALFERFSYRFQLWKKERSDEPAGGGNPLRIFAVVAAISLIPDAYYIFGQHRIDAMIVIGVIAAIAFLFLYWRHSIWAWYLIVIEGPVFLLLYWLLLAVGGLSRPPRPAPLGFQIGVTAFQIALLVGVMIWLFMLREPYARYITDARSHQ